MLQEVYGIFGFTFNLMLSTRPEKYEGEIAVWDKAEFALKKCLNKFFIETLKNQQSYGINEGDGAFYGPKIDIELMDALKRKYQCGTIQLDFQLPEKFKLKYKTSGDGFERPCIIHRAILGSVERMMAVLIEHTGGKWPFWLSPRQIIIIPVHTENNLPYANEVANLIQKAGNYYVDVDNSTDQLSKKVRNAQLQQYNFILVVGASDQQEKMVTVRERGDMQMINIANGSSVEENAQNNKPYQIPITVFLDKLTILIKEYK